jgi:hypothetical protein
MSFEFTTLDDDLLNAGIDGYVKSGGSSYNPIYPLKSNEERRVYFVTDPWTKNEDYGWFSYRAVAAFEGLRGGYQLPNGCKEFPVNDQEIVVDSDGVRRRKSAPRGTDPILELVAPSTKYPPADGRVKGTDKYAVNVIDEEGNHIILTMSGARGSELVRIIAGFREVDDTFTCTKYPWVLKVIGGPGSYSLTAKPLPKEPPIELPDPINIKEVMTGIRHQVEVFVKSLTGDQSVEEAVVVEDSIVDTFESSVATSAEDYTTMSAVRLKALLTKKGVAIPPRCTQPALAELAASHL